MKKIILWSTLLFTLPAMAMNKPCDKRKNIFDNSRWTSNKKVVKGRNIVLENLLDKPASLKLLASWQIAMSHNAIELDQVGEAELLILIDKIKKIRKCCCAKSEKKFFIKLLNNPGITDQEIEESFPKLIKQYLKKERFQNKQQLLNSMLLGFIKFGCVEPYGLCLLIKLGADFSNKKAEVLRLACFAGNKELVQIVLDSDDDITDKTLYNEALLTAATYSHIEIMEMLLNKGADIDARDDHGWTPFVTAMRHVWDHSIKDMKPIIEMLLDRGANIDAADQWGRTALWLAGDNEEIIQLLLERGINVYAKNDRGCTFLNDFCHFSGWDYDTSVKIKKIINDYSAAKNRN